MIDVPQRVDVLEKRMDDHTQLFKDIRDDFRRAETRADTRFGQIDARITALDQKVDSGFARLEGKMGAGFARHDQRTDAGFARLDQKMDVGFASLDGKFDALRHDMTTHFRWTAGIMITCLATILAGMGGLIAVVASR